MSEKRAYFATGEVYELVEDFGNGEVLIKDNSGNERYDVKVDWEDEDIYAVIEE